MAVIFTLHEEKKLSFTGFVVIYYIFHVYSSQQRFAEICIRGRKGGKSEIA